MAETPPDQPASARRPFPLLDHQPQRAGLWAIALGVLVATGFQPLGIWPLAVLAMGGFTLIAARAQCWRRATWLGWLFGMGYFTFGNNWIATAFTYQANMPAVLGWLAVPLLSLVLALFPALAAGAARAIDRTGGPRWAFALVFASCWVLAEWLRSWVLTGFAWNPLAMVLLGPFDRPGIAGLASFMGTYALSGLVVLIGFVLVRALMQRRLVYAGAQAIVLVLAMYGPAYEARDSDILATVVQPNIDQARLHVPENYEDHFQRLANNSLPQEPGATRIVLWPESGMVDYLQEGYPQAYYASTTYGGSPLLARRRMANAIGEASLLMTGAIDLEFAQEDGFIRTVGARNAVTLVDDEGALAGSYFKSHLVPFGEYVPLRSVLEPLGLDRLVPGAFDFLPGEGRATLDLGAHGKAGILICYEIIFSGQVTEPGNRPDYLFNPSNDGWYGVFGPHQHFAQARMRAIEEGLPVLRSTTTGISGIIDANGVVRGAIGMGEQGRVDGYIPAARPPTMFARLGNVLTLIWAAIFLALGFVAMRRRAG